MAESPIESVKEAINGIGVAKIAIVAVLLLLVLGYVFLYPKPGTITINVKALDGDALPGAEVTLADSNGKTLDPVSTDDSGTAVFSNVAPGDYSASVDPGAGYETASDSVSLASGGEASDSVEVERASSVTVAAEENPSTLPLSCERKIVFDLTNKGQAEESVQLVGDGGLKDVFTAPLAAVPPSGGLAIGSFLAAKGKAGDSLKGKVRVKGTRNGVEFSFVLGGVPKVSVSPQTISGDAQPGGVIQKQITVSNDGDDEIAVKQSDITVEGSYAGSYSWTFFEADSNGIAHIEPHGKVSWWISLAVPENAVGKLVGVIKIPLACRTLRVDIDTTAKD